MAVYSTYFIFELIGKAIKDHALEDGLDSMNAKEDNIHMN